MPLKKCLIKGVQSEGFGTVLEQRDSIQRVIHWQRGALAENRKHWWGMVGAVKLEVGNNWEQLVFPEGSCGGSVVFPACGVVNVPEFLSKPAKLNSDHIPTQMFLSHESYAAPLIFLGGRIHQNELLAGRHSCRKRDESAAEVQPTDVGFLLKRLFVIPTSVNQNRQILYQVRDRLRIAQDRNSCLEREAVKAITAAFASEGPSK